MDKELLKEALILILQGFSSLVKQAGLSEEDLDDMYLEAKMNVSLRPASELEDPE